MFGCSIQVATYVHILLVTQIKILRNIEHSNVHTLIYLHSPVLYIWEKTKFSNVKRVHLQSATVGIFFHFTYLVQPCAVLRPQVNKQFNTSNTYVFNGSYSSGSWVTGARPADGLLLQPSINILVQDLINIRYR